ncbi:cell wall-associated NlpC family hydrolase [Nakamurella sp. UYEF19]|uniref:C40 family peptidase n=1 Tax=Nakamurella sp. UYEF19 TaxID=1756392 RepID=UPI00339A2388
MATPHLLPLARTTRGFTGLIVGIVLMLVLGVMGATPSWAAPTGDPSTSKDAKQAWEDSSHQAEIAAEKLNGARVDQTRAAAVAAAATEALATAKFGVVKATERVTATDKAVAGYQTRLDAFASASFRGARLSPLATMLTSQSASDFLDQATMVARVAEDSRHTMNDALAAKTAAAAARGDAQSAQASATQAKTAADAADAAAVSATASAAAQKTALDGAVVKYKALYGKLSEQERQAAAAAAAKAKAESEAAAREVQRQAELQAAAEASAAAQQRAAVAAALVPTTSSTSTTSTSSTSAPDPTTSTASVAAAPSDSSSSSSSAAGSSSSSASSTASTSTAPSTGGGDDLGRIAAQAALTKVGGGYCYACDGPSSFDCSGLTTWAWAQAGISIPRVSYEQANFPEVPLDQLQPGDLVTYYSPVSHVAIYVGNGMVVSAVDESSGILLRPVTRGGPNATGHRVPRG